MLCAECGAAVPVPSSPDAVCGKCGGNPLDIGDWGQIKAARRGEGDSIWTRPWW